MFIKIHFKLFDSLEICLKYEKDGQIVVTQLISLLLFQSFGAKVRIYINISKQLPIHTYILKFILK